MGGGNENQFHISCFLLGKDSNRFVIFLLFGLVNRFSDDIFWPFPVLFSLVRGCIGFFLAIIGHALSLQRYIKMCFAPNDWSKVRFY